MSNLPNKCPKCGLPYCNPVGGRGACWEIDGNGCLERQLAAAVKEREEYRKRWKLVARDESDTIGEYIELEKNFAAVTAERDALKAKLDAAARLAESTRESVGLLWRPIETAPKDGTKVLVMSDGIEIVSWNECLETWWDGEWSHVPTHWMPLPEPPAILNDAREAGKD